MAQGNPNPSPATRFQAGVSGNPSGQPKEAAKGRVLWQRMWGLYYESDPQFEVLAEEYPRIAEQIVARARQAIEGHSEAMKRVDTEGVGPMEKRLTFGDLKEADDDTVRRLAGMDVTK